MSAKLAGQVKGKGGETKPEAPTEGLFVALEGTAGAGEQAQLALLKQRLEQAGYEVVVFDFSRFDQPSSYFIREYLNGQYGSLEEVDPYTSSLFFTLERYHLAPQIKQAVDAGKVVLAHRFIGASMAYHGLRFGSSEQRRGYFVWLEQLEFERFKIPRPALNLVLRLPAELATPHHVTPDLAEAVTVYDDICQLFAKDFRRIDCVRGGERLSSAALNDLIWQSLQPFLPALGTKLSRRTATPSAQTSPAVKAPLATYFTPANLKPAVLKKYQAGILKLLDLQAELHTKLQAYASKQSGQGLESKVEQAARLVLPLASSDQDLAPPTTDTVTLAAKLPSHSEDHAPLTLLSYAPKNELELATDILFSHTDLSFGELDSALNKVKYDAKANLIEEYLKNSPAHTAAVLQHARYRWQILSSYAEFAQLTANLKSEDWQRQPLTPRYGYDTPVVIEQAGLVELFDACFDASLALYSTLQAAGCSAEAQYATLLGHKLRWQLSINAEQFARLLDTSTSAAGDQLTTSLHEQLGSVHPLLAEALHPKT